MEKTKNYYYNLPEDYKLYKVIDAKNKKTAILLSLLSLVLFVIAFVIVFLIVRSFKELNFNFERKDLLILYAYILALLVYVVLHELTHGIAYKIFTHEKLTFGLTLTVAYCGVPNLYVNKKTSLISTLAPFVIFNIVFLLPLFFIQSTISLIGFILLFSMHFSGCIGDLWVALLIIFKFNKKDILVNDTGPKQSFYVNEK